MANLCTQATFVSSFKFICNTPTATVDDMKLLTCIIHIIFDYNAVRRYNVVTSSLQEFTEHSSGCLDGHVGSQVKVYPDDDYGRIRRWPGHAQHRDIMDMVRSIRVGKQDRDLERDCKTIVKAWWGLKVFGDSTHLVTQYCLFSGIHPMATSWQLSECNMKTTIL